MPDARPRALINGFGRIGRLALRRALGARGGELPPFDVVAVNDPSSAESAAYLLEFDSVQGRFGSVETHANGGGFTVSAPGRAPAVISFTAVKDPAEVGRGAGRQGAEGAWRGMASRACLRPPPCRPPARPPTPPHTHHPHP